MLGVGGPRRAFFRARAAVRVKGCRARGSSFLRPHAAFFAAASLFRGEKFTARRSRKTPLDATPVVRPELRCTALHGQRRPTSRWEIDATPAVRKKIPRTASRNDAQPDDKPKNPCTDPGISRDP
ncbi:hypothetical protein NDU88_005867 [Pleurodeles waltl]|uniref:Uncharacterized protein n=1 Tax=Pleurodeles waltl TaxID=8319 RepID=A0AAV7SMU9_PLEWA|nr:hypothetical protein NDU88_005867 [Pleurodeles waltl]